MHRETCGVGIVLPRAATLGRMGSLDSFHLMRAIPARIFASTPQAPPQFRGKQAFLVYERCRLCLWAMGRAAAVFLPAACAKKRSGCREALGLSRFFGRTRTSFVCKTELPDHICLHQFSQTNDFIGHRLGVRLTDFIRDSSPRPAACPPGPCNSLGRFLREPKIIRKNKGLRGSQQVCLKGAQQKGGA
jgi:hypothetical protein